MRGGAGKGYDRRKGAVAMVFDRLKGLGAALENLPSDETLKGLLKLADRLDELPPKETLERLAALGPIVDRLSRDGSLRDLTRALTGIQALLEPRSYERLVRVLELLPRNLPDAPTLRRLLDALEKLGPVNEFLKAVKGGPDG